MVDKLGGLQRLEVFLIDAAVVILGYDGVEHIGAVLGVGGDNRQLYDVRLFGCDGARHVLGKVFGCGVVAGYRNLGANFLVFGTEFGAVNNKFAVAGGESGRQFSVFDFLNLIAFNFHLYVGQSGGLEGDVE